MGQRAVSPQGLQQGTLSCGKQHPQQCPHLPCSISQVSRASPCPWDLDKMALNPKSHGLSPILPNLAPTMMSGPYHSYLLRVPKKPPHTKHHGNSGCFWAVGHPSPAEQITLKWHFGQPQICPGGSSLASCRIAPQFTSPPHSCLLPSFSLISHLLCGGGETPPWPLLSPKPAFFETLPPALAGCKEFFKQACPFSSH